jgi:hypothetical protein
MTRTENSMKLCYVNEKEGISSNVTMPDEKEDIMAYTQIALNLRETITDLFVGDDTLPGDGPGVD